MGLSPKDGLVIGFKGGKRGVEQFAPRNHDDVIPGSEWLLPVAPEQVPDPPFRAIALDGPSQLSRRDDPEPGDRERVGPNDHRQEAAARTVPLVENRLKIGPFPQPFGGSQALVRSGCACGHGL